MSYGPEWEQVEKPLLKHLSVLGWETLIWGQHQEGDDVSRDSEREVLLKQRLSSALKRINLEPSGEQWLDASQINSAIAELRTIPAGTALLEANQRSTKLLLDGVTVPGLGGSRERIINYICWNSWAANNFLAVSQFRVATPGKQPNIRPDVALFVNGIPLVVIEAKPPGTESGIADAIDQLRRYANQRDSDLAEGAEQLFWTNQFTVATTGERAEAGTFSVEPEHYLAWKDPYPTSREEVAASLGKPVKAVTAQEILTTGMLAPERLLDIIRHFTLFKETGSGSTTKLVGRYQQYRGVQKALHRLRNGPTRTDDGHADRRGGIIWHTQGSGKSLTMVFLIRAMRSDPDLRKFKIVLVTDRTDLEIQLRNAAALTDETVKVAKSATKVRELLSQPGPGVVMAMIQKYRDPNDEHTDGLKAEEAFAVLNDSESILVMADEAHRSQTSTLHANLMAALPNAARIGFTGTPIIMGQRKKTLEIFGDYIDHYTLAQSEADESTVPIFYEGRTTDIAVSGASKMDEVFFRWFSNLTAKQREKLQQKYATTTQILEAPELIAAKAKNILRHYIATVMPDGFKAMIVATSRAACLRYYTALNTARDELLFELEQRQNKLKLQPNRSDQFETQESFLDFAALQADLIRALEFAPVISGDHNDPPHYAEWSDKQRQQTRINNFKLPLGVGTANQSPLGILIVKSMLLTGFDAPWAQALYLDRMIQEAELLQAVARVNRTAPKKSHGLVVDYYGVSSQLTTALAAYAKDDGDIDPDAEGALRPLAVEIEKLEPQRQRVRQLFVQRGVEPSSTEASLEECVWVLRDERLRAEFDMALRMFLSTLDTVLPRPEALPYVADSKLFSEVQIRTRQRYRDTPEGDFDPFKYSEKVRQLIDEHISVLDLTQKIPPIRITDPDFRIRIKNINAHRAKASEMEHATRTTSANTLMRILHTTQIFQNGLTIF